MYNSSKLMRWLVNGVIYQRCICGITVLNGDLLTRLLFKPQKQFHLDDTPVVGPKFCPNMSSVSYFHLATGQWFLWIPWPTMVEQMLLVLLTQKPMGCPKMGHLHQNAMVKISLPNTKRPPKKINTGYEMIREPY